MPTELDRASQRPGVPAPRRRSSGSTRLGRREQLGRPDELELPEMRKLELPRAGLLAPIPRFLSWFFSALVYGLLNLVDRLRGRSDPAQRALRLRRLIEAQGGVAVWLGRLVGTRLDLFSFESVSELSAMNEVATPIPPAAAQTRLEELLGRPVAEAFAEWDPDPIVVDAVACVYQAVLHSGERVAVKLRRPGVARAIAVERQALRWVASFLEWLTYFRPGWVHSVSRDFDRLILGQLDFALQARNHRVLRKFAKRDRVGFITAARVFDEFTHDELLVSEFVSGAWCYEVLAAQRSQDIAALAKLSALDIDPKKVGQNLLEASWWGLFECVLFESLPQPASIVVRPGNKLVFVALTDCGSISPQDRRQLRDVYVHLAQRDPYSAATALVHSLSPLPLLDTTEFARKIEQRFWNSLFGLLDRKAPWVDRVSVPLWVAVCEVARESGIQLRLNTFRAVRSLILFDLIAGEAWPRVNLLKAFRRYMRGAHRRLERRTRKDAKKLIRRGILPELVAAGADLSRRVDKVSFWLDTITNQLPVDFFAVASKSSYFFSVVIRVLLVATVATLGGLSLWLGVAYWRGEPVSFGVALQDVVAHPAMLGVYALLLVFALRRVMFRLADVDLD